MGTEKITGVKTTGNLALLLRDVVDLKQAEKALKNSELRYRRLFEAAKDGILILDAETGKIMDVNPFLIEMLGYSKEQFIEKAIWEIGLFKDVVANRDNFVELQQNDYIRYEDMPLQTVDGRRIEVEFVSNAYIVDNQKVIQCNIRNITDRKNLEEALNVSELRYRRLFETAKDGILILDAETGKIMDVNPFLIEMLGYSKEQFIEKAIWEIGLFKDIVANRDNFLELQQKEYIRYDDLPLETVDGRRIAVEFVSNVYIVDNQKVIQCNIRDITERKQAKRELQEAKDYLENLINQANALIIVWDAKFQITRVNNALELITGRKADEVLGKTLQILFPPDKVSNYMTLLKNIQKGKSLQAVEINIIHVNGSVRTILWNSKTIYDSDGMNILSTIAQGQDITDRKKAEEENIYNSFHDQLTGLYNRRFYEEELKRLDIARNLPISLIMGDVNGLKLINDSLGHVMGDNLLKKVAEVLKKGCRADEIIARLGGDEFVILLPKTNAIETEEIIKRLKDLISKEKAGPFEMNLSFGFETKINTKENMQEIFKNAEDHMYRHKLSESSSARSKTVGLILNTLFEKSNREMQHSKRVSEICVDIATRMNFDLDDINQIRTVGLLHDIGKIGIDERILNKPQRLNDDERKEIERHSGIGYQILSSVNDFSEIADYVLEHHEKWDGKGYPKGLKVEEISLQARIIAVADSYDAMTSERSYRIALSKEEAINEIKRCSGTQFDPGIVKVFVEIEEGTISDA